MRGGGGCKKFNLINPNEYSILRHIDTKPIDLVKNEYVLIPIIILLLKKSVMLKFGRSGRSFDFIREGGVGGVDGVGGVWVVVKIAIVCQVKYFL